MGSPQAAIPSGSIHLFQNGVLSCTAGKYLLVHGPPHRLQGMPAPAPRAAPPLPPSLTSHCSFSLFSPPPPPPVLFFLKHVFSKKQENCPVVGPIQPMGTGTAPFPLSLSCKNLFHPHPVQWQFCLTQHWSRNRAGCRYSICRSITGLMFRLRSCRNPTCPWSGKSVT